MSAVALHVITHKAALCIPLIPRRWQEGGGCRLNANEAQPWLHPLCPCAPSQLLALSTESPGGSLMSGGFRVSPCSSGVLGSAPLPGFATEYNKTL